MLYHLREPDYTTLVPCEVPTRFFARDARHILETLADYQRQVQQRGYRVNDLPWWARVQFEEKDLEEVEKGCFYFCSGMIRTDRQGELFEEIPITGEFSLYIPEENMLRFLEWRTEILSKKRGNLYKLQNPIQLGMNISFVPEDIAFALSTFDFSSYKEVVEREMAFREQLVEEGVFLDLHSKEIIY